MVRDRFENIDLLRAFAAMAVVVYHVIELTHWTSFPTTGPLLTFRIGWIGVDLFFVISGFVITHSALALYRQNAGEFKRRYWAHRLSRILPLYLVTCALWIALFLPGFFQQPARLWAQQIFAHLTFTHTFWPATFGSIDGVNWTLGLEMQFYLTVALLIRWIDRTSGWRIWLSCILIAWTWRASMVFFFGHDDAAGTFMRMAQLPGTLDEFGAGMFLAKLVEGRSGSQRRVGWGWLVAAVAIGTVCMGIYWPRASYWDDAAMIVFWHTTLAAFMLCVVASAVYLPAFAERWPTRPVRYLGEVSYGIYLWHPFAIQACLAMTGITPPAALAATVGLTVLAAATSWHVFEKPILAYGRRLPGRRVPASGTSERGDA
ncbi:MAG: acyltransferase [Casimicrobiaceae bacterium]